VNGRMTITATPHNNISQAPPQLWRLQPHSGASLLQLRHSFTSTPHIGYVALACIYGENEDRLVMRAELGQYLTIYVPMLHLPLTSWKYPYLGS
jgi:hypothetical protein